MAIDLMQGYTFCPTCDCIIDNESGYCRNCGYELEDAEEQGETESIWEVERRVAKEHDALDDALNGRR